MIDKRRFDIQQKRILLSHARRVILSFRGGIILADDPKPFEIGNFGFVLFEGYGVRFNIDYITALRDFTGLASKMLKARNAHEQTIRALCQDAGQAYVKLVLSTEETTPGALESVAISLVETVLNEVGREYVHIEPNFLMIHDAADIVSLGRVRSMRTEMAGTITELSGFEAIRLELGRYPDMVFDADCVTLCMPQSVWVVEVPATLENVTEESKWLIDVAVSLIRLSTAHWPRSLSRPGAVEPHPTYPTIHDHPHITLDGDSFVAGRGKRQSCYQVTAEVAADLASREVQEKASILFDPADKSLAQCVAQGLGWMTRGRQASDRAERLLSFFTALEALLTSDSADPVTQTISRHVSVIWSQDLNTRVSVYNQIKRLYSLRSAVVHRGQREVMWQDVNSIQAYVESVFWIVIDRCDLRMSQEVFSRSLADASHGLPWSFASSKVIGEP